MRANMIQPYLQGTRYGTPRSVFSAVNIRMLPTLLAVLSLAGFCFIAGCKRSSAPVPEAEEKAVGPAVQPAAEMRSSVSYSTKIPPKNQWHITASGVQEDIYPPESACDDDRRTRWSSPPSDPQWLRIDLGEPAWLCGLTIYWETAHASAYEIRLSTDGETWKSVYSTDCGDGASDIIYFAPTPARYVEITGRKRATGWGYSIWELDLKGLDQQPVVWVNGATNTLAARVFDGDTNTTWQASLSAPVEMVVDLRATQSLGSVHIEWGNAYATVFGLEASKDGTDWQPIQRITNGTGRFDVIFTPQTEAQFLRWRFESASADGIEIREIIIKGADESVTPLLRYQLAAQKAHVGVYPLHLLRQQVYWTVVGLPGDDAESLFDEFGNLEPVAQGPSLTPLLRLNGRLTSAWDAKEIRQGLDEGYMPLPFVEWTTPEGLRVRAEAFTWGDKGHAVTAVRYSLANQSDRVIQGDWYLAIRPVQINPPWQYGGLSHIRKLEMTVTNGICWVEVNGQVRFAALTLPDSFGARRFDGGDIAADLARGIVPESNSVVQPEELVSGVLAYPLDLQPGDTKAVIIVSPLAGRAQDVESFRRPGSGPAFGDPEEAFLSRQRAVREMWRDKLGRVEIELPDTALNDALRAQIAYIYINQDGPAIQPGPRNYNRSWIRDGALTSAALLRMGHPEPVRAFLDWYAERVQPDGWVPPILNPDGTINKGFGWDNEYDSQGEFVFALMDYYRFTGDRAMLEANYDKIVRALRYAQNLRERTTAADYREGEPGRDRFIGILPPSISHEGYSPAMHSYWDDFWALKGWRDGAEAARTLGDAATAQWCDEQYALLRDALNDSIKKTMAFKKIDFIPGCADKGDADATSTAIAFFSCEVADDLPEEQLSRTFERYGEEIVARSRPGGWTGGYTPYEWRNISAFAELGYEDYLATLVDFLKLGIRPAGWRHWGEVVLPDYRMGSYVGDMPHTWVGAGFVTAIRGLLVRERKDGSLVLFEGAPSSWFSERNGVVARNLPTYFGKMDLSARLEGNRFYIRLRGDYKVPGGILLRWPRHDRPANVTVRDTKWTRFDEKACHLSGMVTGEIVAEWP